MKNFDDDHQTHILNSLIFIHREVFRWEDSKISTKRLDHRVPCDAHMQLPMGFLDFDKLENKLLEAVFVAIHMTPNVSPK